jgi:hypothetical protein
MRKVWRQSASSWRIPEARALQPGWILGACLLLAMLLLEVWQQSMVASLSLRAGRASDELKRASNELDWTRAQLDRSATRAEVGTLAFSAGVRPGEAAQVVWLPADYLEDDGAVGARVRSPGLLDVAGRAFQSIVPEAKARSRNVH